MERETWLCPHMSLQPGHRSESRGPRQAAPTQQGKAPPSRAATVVYNRLTTFSTPRTLDSARSSAACACRREGRVESTPPPWAECLTSPTWIVWDNQRYKTSRGNEMVENRVLRVERMERNLRVERGVLRVVKRFLRVEGKFVRVDVRVLLFFDI